MRIELTTSISGTTHDDTIVVFFRRVHCLEPAAGRECGCIAWRALRAELLALRLPDAAGENCPELYERAVSAALGLCLAGRGDQGSAGTVWSLDGPVNYRAGKSVGELMSSFGHVRYERSQYRRRNCGSVFPADARFRLIGEFWSPLAARQGSLSLSLVPVKDCEGLFQGDAAVGDGAEQPCGDDGFGLGRCA